MIDIAISESINRFGMELYALLRNRQGTLFFSPPSIACAFAMTYAGARGRTAEEIAAVLRLPRDASHLHEAWSDLLDELGAKEQRRGYYLMTLNALCGQLGTVFNDEYRKILTTYGALTDEYEFSTAGEAARLSINAWATERTAGKIRYLLEPGAIRSDTRLLLSCALYFRGQWVSQFRAKRTEDAEFRVAPGYSVSVPMMFQEERFNCLVDDTVDAIELPYVGYEYSLMVFLPREADGLEQFEKSLTPETLANWLLEFRARQVSVWLPRLRLEASLELNRVLSDLGMPLTFSQDADFSGMTAAVKGVPLSAALHKAVFTVNEEGKEAAAATNPPIAMIPQPAAPASFRADHPFFFFVRHNPTGAILLMGRVTNPREALVSLVG